MAEGKSPPGRGNKCVEVCKGRPAGLGKRRDW